MRYQHAPYIRHQHAPLAVARQTAETHQPRSPAHCQQTCAGQLLTCNHVTPGPYKIHYLCLPFAHMTPFLHGPLLCCSIYPMDSPGGYQLVGRTLPIWNSFGRAGPFTAQKPWLLEFFDQVTLGWAGGSSATTCCAVFYADLEVQVQPAP
eukprot:GHRQ01031908.1.p1 GENE.GHRQ01031908.1~~GHRQ01031908.1.p1  ORF type:complete len:150 (+),score=19.59 GHRQ01031908.1:55-504(+)